LGSKRLKALSKMLVKLTTGHGGFVASQKFYLSAMEIYRNKYNSPNSKIVFVMASDDEPWCRTMFGNVSDNTSLKQLK